MILVDSSYLIALMNEKDQYHKRALKLYGEMEDEEKVIPLLMLSEAITSVNARKGGEFSKILYDVLSDDFNIYFPDNEDMSHSMDCVVKYGKSLSLADCLAVHIMKKANILYIYSFDSDFDKVDGIIRMH